MEINERVLKKTTLCTNNFACLIKNNSSLKKLNTCSGTIEKIVSNKFVFVKCSDIFCSYHTKFGEATVCECPTRIEINNKYNR